MSWLSVHTADGDRDYDTIRKIRNICREGFSNTVTFIDRDAQARWLAETENKRLAWLYFDERAFAVGFGLLLLQDDGLWTTTVAVLPQFAGKGYGKWITHDIVTRCPGECRATARKDNPAAVKLHVSDDWDVVDGLDDRLVYFRTKAKTYIVGERGPELFTPSRSGMIVPEAYRFGEI